MKKHKRRFTKRLIKAARRRLWAIPGSKVWLATDLIARPGVVFTPEQRARIQAMVASWEAH